MRASYPLVAMNRKRLAIYLNDHMAAATGGAELAGRVARANRGTPYGETLAELRTEIEDDREALVSIMGRLGVGVDPVRRALGWSAEKLGRLKLNGQLTGYSPLSRFEELEILTLGVTGKLLLWEALQRVEPTVVSEEELARLADRARTQRERLDSLRLRAADEALGE
jgi:hypothetical protein